MYLGQTVVGNELEREATAKAPFGPGFSKETVQKADSMQIWHTSFKDADEYTEFRLLKGEEVVATARFNGY
jgi:hypothetical protein